VTTAVTGVVNDASAGTGLVAGTTPYPWPYDGALSPARVALLVLGWNDEWWAQCHEPAAAAGVIVSLAVAVDTVITVDQTPPTVHGRLDAEPAAGSRPDLDARRVEAVGVDGFFGGPLDAVLRAAGCDLLLLAGLGLEAAVHSTMRSANDRGYECLLVVDACAPLDPTLVLPAISMVEMSGGIFGAVGTTAPVLAALAAACSPDPIPDFSERTR
jgi:hypothetical protein